MESDLEPSAATDLDTDMSTETTAAEHESEDGGAEQNGGDAYSVVRLKRSIKAAEELIGALKEAKKLVHKLAPVFDQKSIPPIGSDASSKREALLAEAESALDSGHPIKLAIAAALGTPNAVDDAINVHALPIRSQVLAPLDALLNQALQREDAETAEEHNEEQAETQAQQVVDPDAFLGALDVRSKEWNLVRRQLAAQLRKARFKRLFSARNLIVAGVLLITAAIAAAAYLLTGTEKPKAANTVATGAIKSAAERVAPAPPSTPPPAPPAPHGVMPTAASTPNATASASAPASVSAPAAAATSASTATATPIPATPAAIAASTSANASAPSLPAPPIPKTPPPTPKAYKRNGLTTVVNSKDKESVKKNVEALGEIIKIWNDETEKQAAHEKGK
jgi:hypothetical protein